jgi:hypothetical protein
LVLRDLGLRFCCCQLKISLFIFVHSSSNWSPQNTAP